MRLISESEPLVDQFIESIIEMLDVYSQSDDGTTLIDSASPGFTEWALLKESMLTGQVELDAKQRVAVIRIMTIMNRLLLATHIRLSGRIETLLQGAQDA